MRYLSNSYNYRKNGDSYPVGPLCFLGFLLQFLYQSKNAQLVHYQIYMKKLISELILTPDDLICKLWIVSSPLTYGFCFLVPLSAVWFSSGTLGSVSHSFLNSVMKKEDIPLRNLIYVLTKYCRKVSQNVSTHLKRSGVADAMDHSCWI